MKAALLTLAFACVVFGDRGSKATGTPRLADLAPAPPMWCDLWQHGHKEALAACGLAG